eukprot:6863803-Alexandrium_andersonii.AAC.1
MCIRDRAGPSPWTQRGRRKDQLVHLLLNKHMTARREDEAVAKREWTANFTRFVCDGKPIDTGAVSVAELGSSAVVQIGEEKYYPIFGGINEHSLAITVWRSHALA